jgi:toluene monooxygenase system protein D
MQDAVGPVLRMCDEIELVIQAIVEDNPDREIEVIGSGSYVRVQTRGFMRVTLDSLQRNVGRTFQMRQLGAMLSSFAGRIATTSDEITWSLTPGLSPKKSSVPPEKESSA